MAFGAKNTSFFRCVILTHGRMPKLTWRVFTDLESSWNFAPFVWRAFLPLYCQIPWRIFVPARQSALTSNGSGRSLFVPLASATVSRSPSFLTLGDWSSFPNIVPNSEVWSSHYVINMKFHSGLQIVNHLSFQCFEQFLDGTEPNQSEAETESCNFDLYNPSRVTSGGISLIVSRAWSQLTSKSWTLSFCNLTVNRFESPCAASLAPLARKYSKMMCAICLPRKNRSAEHVALRH